MDDEYFEATKDTCVFLGGKLTIIINMININIIISASINTNIGFSITSLLKWLSSTTRVTK